jgi:hypothetical protein
MTRRSTFMTSKERKAAAAPVVAPKPKSNLPKWDPKSGEEFNGYQHANKEDKGEKDGSCNRTACQAPLKGERQYYMREDFNPNGRVYYCETCADMFGAADRRFNPGEPLRCTLDRTTV